MVSDGSEGTSTSAVAAPFHFVARIPFPSATYVKMAAHVLRVENTIPQTVLNVDEEGFHLVLRLHSPSSRALRTGVHAVLEQLALVVRTLQKFAPTATTPSVPSQHVGDA